MAQKSDSKSNIQVIKNRGESAKSGRAAPGNQMVNQLNMSSAQPGDDGLLTQDAHSANLDGQGAQ